MKVRYSGHGYIQEFNTDDRIRIIECIDDNEVFEVFEVMKNFNSKEFVKNDDLKKQSQGKHHGFLIKN